MGWTFHSAEGSSQNRRVEDQHIASHIKHLEHLEAELVRRLVTLTERHAFFPNEVTDRQVKEVAAKLQALRNDLDAARSVHPLPRDWA
jgi:hypothetical protein